MTGSIDNLAFTPQPITAVPLRPGDGPQIQVAQPIIQRTAALRAYNAFSSGRDWMEKISNAYIVALATRSADICLMRRIQSAIPESPSFTFKNCREATIGIETIRAKLFPELQSLRKHANNLIHHLDHPENHGVANLNVKGAFDYCYHLFQEHSELLFGDIPEGSFEFKACKDHRQRSKRRKSYAG